MGLRLFKKPFIVATHNGSFHADDVFGVATLSLWAEKNNRPIEIIRTRDVEKIKKADMAVDVGGIYDASKNRFDHHQKDGAGKHELGHDIPYASFGLVWKKYGYELYGRDIAAAVEVRLAEPIDAIDNGLNLNIKSTELGISGYSITDAVNAFIPVSGKYSETDGHFKKAVAYAKEIIIGEASIANGEIEGEKKAVVAISKQDDPEVLIFEERLMWEKAVSKNENTKFVISPDSNGRDWNIKSVRNDLTDFTSNRASFPASWCGLRDKELEKTCGVPGAIFCHRGGYFAVAKTKDAAVAMAKKALENK